MPTTKILILALFSLAGCVVTWFFVSNIVEKSKRHGEAKNALREKRTKEIAKMNRHFELVRLYLDYPNVYEEAEGKLESLLNELNFKVEEE